MPISSRGWRLIVLAALVVALFFAGRAGGLGAHLSKDGVRALVEQSGPWGAPLFVGLFAVGLLLHVPALAFVAAAVLAWGRPRGAVYAYGGALVAATLCFAVVRFVGGRPLATVSNRHVRAILARLEKHPIQSVAILRALFLVAPVCNYSLALSPISFGAYFVGSALGLIPSVAVTTTLFGVLFR